MTDLANSAAATDEPAKKPEPPKAALQPMGVDAHGLVVAKDHQEVWRQITGWVRSGILPKAYQESVGNNNARYDVTFDTACQRAYLAHQTLVSMHQNPLTNFRFCTYVESAVVFFGDLPLSLVKQSGLLDGTVEEYWLDADKRVISEANGNLDELPTTAICKLRRKGEETVVRTYTLKEARIAGKYLLDDEGNAVKGVDSRDLDKFRRSCWAKHTKRMLQMRARGHAIKDVFPDVLSGVRQLEYDMDISEHQAANADRIYTAAEAQQAGIAKRSSLNELY